MRMPSFRLSRLLAAPSPMRSNAHVIPAAIRVSANLSVLSPSLTSSGGKNPKTSHSKSTTRAGAWLRGDPSARSKLHGISPSSCVNRPRLQLHCLKCKKVRSIVWRSVVWMWIRLISDSRGYREERQSGRLQRIATAPTLATHART